MKPRLLELKYVVQKASNGGEIRGSFSHRCFENYNQRVSFSQHSSCGFSLQGIQKNLLVFSDENQIHDPIRTNPSGMATHTRQVDRVRRGLYKARGYFELGDFDNAIEEFDKVLLIDPYNQAARRGQQEVFSQRRSYYSASYDETRSRLLTEVDKAWEVFPTNSSYARNNSSMNSTGAVLNVRKLRQIIIPVFDLENTSLTSAINRLSQAIIENDPEPDEERKGVSFVIRRSQVQGVGYDNSDILIDQLSLRNVPAAEVLSQICKKCDRWIQTSKE